ncbi:MAG: type II toxin-antitoxin system VapC family toxin [Bacteroidetes bacterium]|nr:type II toxin-antitoxin system VapC family toxin [Bacteroidota bacterium]
MNLLLDTHILLWFIAGDKKLSQKQIKEISSPNNKRFVSIASVWEIAIKLSLDKLEIKGGFQTIQEFFIQNDVEILSIEFHHLNKLMKLPKHHRDPFDRIIISQALAEKLILISNDKFFEQYKVKLFS